MGKKKRSHFGGKIGRKVNPLIKFHNNGERNMTFDFATKMLPSMRLGHLNYTILTKVQKSK